MLDWSNFRYNLAAVQLYITTSSSIAVSPSFYIKQTDTANRTIYIDGVTLVQASSGLSFSPPAGQIQVDSQLNTITLNANNSGELQPWKQNANALPAIREDAATATSNGYIYTIGGYDGSVGVGTTYYTKMKLMVLPGYGLPPTLYRTVNFAGTPPPQLPMDTFMPSVDLIPQTLLQAIRSSTPN